MDTVKSFELTNDYEAAILFVIDYLEINQHMLNCVYDSVGRDELKLYLYKDFTEIAGKIIAVAENQLGKNLPEDYKKLLVMFYTDGIVGIVVEWLHSGIHLDKATAVKYVTEIFKGSLTGLIEGAGRD